MSQILRILKQRLPYLDSSRNKLWLILFLVLFIFIFLSVYAPFNMNQWEEKHYLGYVTIGGFILLLTQFVLRPLFGFHKIKVSSLILWGVIELTLITYGIYLAYSPELATFGEKLYEFYQTMRFVALVSLGPYALFLWYLRLNHKFTSLKKTPIDSLTTSVSKSELMIIVGNNNKVLIAINYNKLLYIKSSGNYLDIKYLKGDKVATEVVRMSLKELESKITDRNIIRIHRSYMVNKQKISSLKKTRKGYHLLMQNSIEEKLPVSLGYKDNFEESLELKVTHSSQHTAYS